MTHDYYAYHQDATRIYIPHQATWHKPEGYYRTRAEVYGEPPNERDGKEDGEGYEDTENVEEDEGNVEEDEGIVEEDEGIVEEDEGEQGRSWPWDSDARSPDTENDAERLPDGRNEGTESLTVERLRSVTAVIENPTGISDDHNDLEDDSSSDSRYVLPDSWPPPRKRRRRKEFKEKVNEYFAELARAKAEALRNAPRVPENRQIAYSLHAEEVPYTSEDEKNTKQAASQLRIEKKPNDTRPEERASPQPEQKAKSAKSYRGVRPLECFMQEQARSKSEVVEVSPWSTTRDRKDVLKLLNIPNDKASVSSRKIRTASLNKSFYSRNN